MEWPVELRQDIGLKDFALLCLSAFHGLLQTVVKSTDREKVHKSLGQCLAKVGNFVPWLRPFLPWHGTSP